MKLYTELRYTLTAMELYQLLENKLPNVRKIRVLADEDTREPYLALYGNADEPIDDHGEILSWIADYVQGKLRDLNVTVVRVKLSWDLLEDYLCETLPREHNVDVIDGSIELSR